MAFVLHRLAFLIPLVKRRRLWYDEFKIVTERVGDMETSFKTCVFGGFDRGDVISFIEKTAAETQEKLGVLTADNQRLREAQQAADAENQALRARNEELIAQLDDEAALRRQVRELQAEAEALRRENDALREPAAQYQSLKDHIADIEISAHRRTEEFRAKAVETLRQLIGQQRQWCAEQRGAYERMTEGVLQQLHRAEHLVEACDLGHFDEFEESLRRLEDTIDQSE